MFKLSHRAFSFAVFLFSFLLTWALGLGLANAVTLDGTLVACGEEPPPVLSGRYSTGANGDTPPADKLAELGRKIFFDPGLSASGKQSCASCHHPAHAYGPANALPVQKGGPHLKDTGFRNTPALRYLHAPFAFNEHHIDLLDGKGQPPGPAGGRTWDGRVNGARERALMSLLDAKEMANKEKGNCSACPCS